MDKGAGPMRAVKGKLKELAVSYRRKGVEEGPARKKSVGGSRRVYFEEGEE